MKSIIDFLLNNWLEILGGVTAAYEFFVRLIPTIKNRTILSKIVAFLKWIDETFNNLKKP